MEVTNNKIQQIVKKESDRLTILERIDEYEKKGWWSKDVEDDPPTVPLTADKVDYLNKKLSNKILTFFVNRIAWNFIKKLVKNNQLRIKEIKGIENFEALLDKGVIITCNHFNAFDNFALHYAFYPYIKANLYKVIREGNFTSFPGFYGLLFRHCNTLPLSSNLSCMKLFREAITKLLERKQKILIYAEQGMWWNYRKPRPMERGAFLFAAKSKAPVLPVFITMTDSQDADNDGFPIQEYTVNILNPIYPDPEKSEKENIDYLRNKNYEAWKNCYEDFYKIPLTYLKEE